MYTYSTAVLIAGAHTLVHLDRASHPHTVLNSSSNSTVREQVVMAFSIWFYCWAPRPWSWTRCRVCSTAAAAHATTPAQPSPRARPRRTRRGPRSRLPIGRARRHRLASRFWRTSTRTRRTSTSCSRPQRRSAWVCRSRARRLDCRLTEPEVLSRRVILMKWEKRERESERVRERERHCPEWQGDYVVLVLIEELRRFAFLPPLY